MVAAGVRGVPGRAPIFGARTWIVPVAVAFCLHGAVAGALIWVPFAPPVEPKQDTIEVVFEPPAPTLPEAEMVSDTAPVEVAAVEPVQAAPAMEPTPVAAIPAPPEPPVVAPATVTSVSALGLLPLPPRRPQAAPQPRETPMKAVAAPMPPAPPVVRPLVTASPQAATPPTAKIKSSGTRRNAAVGAGYVSRLLAWLERHKEYPREARNRRQEGTVRLAFTIARDGTVLAYRIEGGSGYPLLDEECLAMIRRAQPLPPIPAEMELDRLNVVVPVRFALR